MQRKTMSFCPSLTACLNIIIHNSEIDQYITKEKYEEIIKNFVILEIELPVNTEFVYTDICGLGENELLLIKEGILEKKK